MTDNTPNTPVYSQDYWDIVISQIRRRPTVMISMILLLGLYAAAIFAPLIANDRPLYFEGTDRLTFRKAQRELSLVIESLSRNPGRSENQAVRIRLETMGRQLVPADRKLIDELRSALPEPGSVTTMDAGTADRLRALAARIQAELTPAASNEAAVPGRTVTLVPFRAWPAIENLSRGEIYFMTLMALVAIWPIVNRIVNKSVLKGDRLAIRRSRRSKGLVFVIVPVLAALAWQGKSAAFYVGAFKEGLTTGEITARRVVFPIVPFGLAENNNPESFRPPTWHLESRINDKGYYEFGGRSGSFDRATGLPKMAQPVTVRFGEPSRNSTLRHPLGTDSLGRDLLTRVCWGARVSLAVGLVSTILLVVIGTFLGSLAGYYGGWVDVLISRIIEVVQTFPVFFLILIVVAFVGPSILNIMLAIGLIRWTTVARLVRGEFIRLRELDFVVASQALGVKNSRTIFRHILPNAMGPVLVAATFSVASGILIESALSFLGFGIQLPIPSWGSLLIESRSAEHWWIQIYPGVLIFITVLLYNLFGEGVRDALDPRLKVTG